MHFGENQLSRSLIGLSPLPTTHPPGFQPWWVRASTRSYPRFTLAMGRSPRFGSTPRDSTPSSDSLSLRLPHNRLTSPRSSNSQAHSSKGTPSPTKGSDGLQAHGFRNSFTPLPGYFSPFPHGTHPLSVTRKYLGLASGPARFTAPSTETLLLGNTTTHPPRIFAYGTLTHSGQASQPVRLTRSNSAGGLVDPPSSAPQPRTRNPYQVSHAHGLASSAFARHYSRNHQCFLFLRVLRCFTSPRSPQHPIHSGAGNPTSLGLGYPIRTPSDHSSVDNSPRTIAASHVLHRPLVPRHPPCALHNLKHKDARTHYTVLKQQPGKHTPQGVFPQNPTADHHATPQQRQHG